MALIFKKYTGVTLFEVMLVLFVSMLIAIAAFQYQKAQNENAVATALAADMYEYSQALRLFVDDNETALTAGMAAPFTSANAPGSTFTQNGQEYIITGVDWLTVVNSPTTNKPYLPTTFSFDNLAPLQLQLMPSSTSPGTGSPGTGSPGTGSPGTGSPGTGSPGTGSPGTGTPGSGSSGTALIGSAAVQATISMSPTAASEIMIEYGALYDANNPANPPIPKTAVTHTAAQLASNMNDPLMGPSSFDYSGGTLDSSGNVLPIIATIKHSTVGGENYLRLDGANSMAGKISFDVVNASSLDVDGVGTLNFDTTRQGSGAITNATSMAMAGYTSTVATGEIAGITKLTMDLSGNGMIDNVNTITFGNTSSLDNLGQIQFGSPGNISGVGTITFTSGQSFKGFGAPVYFYTCGGGSTSFGGLNSFTPGGSVRSTMACSNAGNAIMYVTYNNNTVLASQYVCALSRTLVNGGGSSNNNMGCELSIDPTNNQYLLYQTNALGCGVLCLPFN